MNLYSRGVLIVVWLFLAIVFAAPVMASEPDSYAKAQVEYSRDPGTVLISFREIFPEFADQDPTPLIRIYGDGRVVVFHPAYMKQAGQYEMMMSRNELEDLLLQLTPVLMNFDAGEVKRQKKAANQLLWNAATELEDLTLFYDSDAEISVFQLNIDAYRPNGLQGQTIYMQALEQSWRGLRYDAKDYLGLKSIQGLMQAEKALKAFTGRVELVEVESLP